VREQQVGHSRVSIWAIPRYRTQGRATFADVLPFTLELAGREDTRIDTSVGNQCLQTRESVDIADFGHDGRGQDWTDAWNGCDVLFNAAEQFCDGLVTRGHLLLEQRNLVQLSADLELRRGSECCQTERLAGGMVECFGLGRARSVCDCRALTAS
jgi:hypothetical protein